MLRICNITDFLRGCVTFFPSHFWNKHFQLQHTIKLSFKGKQLYCIRCEEVTANKRLNLYICPFKLEERKEMYDVCQMQTPKLWGNDAKYVLQFLQSPRSRTRCVYSDFHLRRTGTWERKKIMSRSLWAAYRRHSAVSSSKISLCWLSTIWWR